VTEKEWTIMVYMAGDNNLSIDMAYALKDIREVVKARNDKVNLMVYYDGNSLNTPTVYCDFTNFTKPLYIPAYTVEKRYKYKSRRGKSEENPEDQNAATMYSIMNFVDWCVNPEKSDKKANKYSLIFSGHGFGFQAISFLKDNSSDYYMTIRRFRASLEKIRDEILNQPLNLVGFDSCVMSMLEIGYEIRDCAETMIASEGSIPNAGWTYGNILGDLVSSSANEVSQAVAKNFVHSFIDSQKEFAIGGVSVDMSAWNLSKVAEVVAAADKLGEILTFGIAEGKRDF